MSKLYRYTLLKCDGTEAHIETRPTDMFRHYMAKAIGVGPESRLELLPSSYYLHQQWRSCSVYADEKARLHGKPVNQHFEYLPPNQTRTVRPVHGDCLRVELVPAEVATA